MDYSFRRKDAGTLEKEFRDVAWSHNKLRTLLTQIQERIEESDLDYRFRVCLLYTAKDLKKDQLEKGVDRALAWMTKEVRAMEEALNKLNETRENFDSFLDQYAYYAEYSSNNSATRDSRKQYHFTMEMHRFLAVQEIIIINCKPTRMEDEYSKVHRRKVLQ